MDYIWLCLVHYYIISELPLDITHLCDESAIITLILIREEDPENYAIIILQLIN